MSHDQAAELLGLLEGAYKCHPYLDATGNLSAFWIGSGPAAVSPEMWASMQKQKSAIISIIEARQKCAELQQRLKQLRSGANG